MINLLIIEDDMNHSKKIINTIASNIDDVRLSHLSFTGNEAIDIIGTSDIDIILLNLSNSSGIDVLTYIVQRNLEYLLNSIIVLANDASLLNEVPNKAYRYIYTIIHKPINDEEFVDRISEIAEHKNLLRSEKEIKSKITNELEKLGFNFSYSGTHYLTEIILTLYHTRNHLCGNFSKNILPVLAKRYHKSVETISGNIKQSIKCMYASCDKNFVSSYFGYSYPMKPRPKEICFTVLNKIS